MAKQPSPPADLDVEGKKDWRETRAALIAQGTWEDHDERLLGDWARARQRARQAIADLPRRKVGRKLVVVMTVEGSQGQDVQHPNLRTARQAEHDALELARELLIPPRARRRAGVGAGTRGDTQASGGDDPFSGAL